MLPPPTQYARRLQLPPHGAQPLGAVTPLLIPYECKPVRNVDETPLWARHPRHRLGVSALALDASTCLAGKTAPEGILYSAGRDGLIIARDLGVPMKRRRARVMPKAKDHWETLTGWADDDVIEEEDEERGPDGDVLGEVVSTVLKKQRSMSLGFDLPIEHQWETDMSSFTPGVRSEFRQSAQAHSDWINDIVLCNYNQTVISASSDGTVKSWNPHSVLPTDPALIGTHADYVRCLALCRERNWVASGSFDKTIKLWDLSRTSQDPLVTLSLADASKSSVYAIASDPFGQIIASGSPERVVRLWDPRTGKRTGKLVGHTDNIRAILLSEDGRYLLTGSADASIKLWSLTSQRCLYTFTHHTESVWSLYSTHPDLETFYSGDRSGLVCRVDVEDCGNVGNGECVLLCNNGSSDSAKDGINRIAVLDDNLMWTASGSSTINQWQIPQKRSKRVVEWPPPQRQSSRPSTGHGKPPPRVSSEHSVHSLFSQQTSPRDDGDKLNGIPLESLVKLSSPGNTFAFTHSKTSRDAEVATLYSAASVRSVPRATVRPLPPLPHSAASRGEDSMIPTSLAHADYEDRELASDAVPFCTEPDDVLKGDDGLVRCIILNDRVHALTVDTAGQVVVWDIIRGVCLGKYLPDDISAASNAGSVVSYGGADTKERSPREALEVVRERIEGEGITSTWCHADTKSGVLTIHLNERCFEGEVYADEVGFSPETKLFHEESKLNLGKWVLRNLFYGFTREAIRRHHNRESPIASGEIMLPPSITRTSGAAPAERTQLPGAPQPPSPESPRKLRHRNTASTDSPRKASRHIPQSSTVVCSPKMIPIVAPIPSSALPRTSPLLTPMIPLLPHKDGLSTIPQSPLPTPLVSEPLSILTNIVSRQRSRSITGDGASGGTGSGSIVRTPSANAGTGSDYFAMRTRHISTTGDETPTATHAAVGVVAGTPQPPLKTEQPQVPPTPTPSTPSGLMGRLKILGKMGKRPVSGTASPGMDAITPTLGTANLLEETQTIEIAKTPIQQILAGPITPPNNVDAPLHAFPPQTVVVISEEAAPSPRTLYRGHIASTQYDVKALDEAVPLWLAECLLLNRLPPMAPQPKISFVLLPWNKDPDVEPLPEMLNSTQSKLTASRYLRVMKILLHVQDKLERIQAHAASGESRAPSARSSVDSQAHHHLGSQQSHHRQSSLAPNSPGGSKPASRPRAEDMYEILCNEAVLPLSMTLLAVRQFVWRQSAELVMYYRRKSVGVQ